MIRAVKLENIIPITIPAAPEATPIIAELSLAVLVLLVEFGLPT